MKKTIRICSVLCAVTAVLALIMGIKVLTVGTGGGFFIGLKIFNMAEGGAFISFIGNLLGMAVSCLGFGALALFGFGSSHNSKRNGFIYGLIMTGISLISSIAAAVSGNFSIGDLLIVLLPAVYTAAILKSA